MEKTDEVRLFFVVLVGIGHKEKKTLRRWGWDKDWRGGKLFKMATLPLHYMDITSLIP
jgi:hypothetical protein